MSVVDGWSIAISAAAFAAAVVGAWIAWRARGDSRRSATAAEAAEHRARRPRLLVEPEGTVQHDATEVIYRVHNLDGPDLASVVVHRPIVGPVDGGGVIYPVSATGRGEYGDTAEIGPIPLAGYSRFTFKLGTREPLPDLRVRITYRAASGAPWELSEPLTTPRGPAQLLLVGPPPEIGDKPVLVEDGAPDARDPEDDLRSLRSRADSRRSLCRPRHRQCRESSTPNKDCCYPSPQLHVCLRLFELAVIRSQTG